MHAAESKGKILCLEQHELSSLSGCYTCPQKACQAKDRSEDPRARRKHHHDENESGEEFWMADPGSGDVLDRPDDNCGNNRAGHSSQAVKEGPTQTACRYRPMKLAAVYVLVHDRVHHTGYAPGK